MNITRPRSFRIFKILQICPLFHSLFHYFHSFSNNFWISCLKALSNSPVEVDSVQCAMVDRCLWHVRLPHKVFIRCINDSEWLIQDSWNVQHIHASTTCHMFFSNTVACHNPPPVAWLFFFPSRKFSSDAVAEVPQQEVSDERYRNVLGHSVHQFAWLELYVV